MLSSVNGKVFDFIEFSVHNVRLKVYAERHPPSIQSTLYGFKYQLSQRTTLKCVEFEMLRAEVEIVWQLTHFIIAMGFGYTCYQYWHSISQSHFIKKGLIKSFLRNNTAKKWRERNRYLIISRLIFFFFFENCVPHSMSHFSNLSLYYFIQ